MAIDIAQSTMEFHEVANLFPLIEGQEFENLVEDIYNNGLQQPIWTYQGKIIDGRNRYRACMEAGIEPRYQEWDGKGSLVAFTVSLNVKRRHLTSSQLSVIALSVEKQLAEEAKVRRALNGGDKVSIFAPAAGQNFDPPLQGKSAHQAADLLGTNHDYVSAVKKIGRNAPELLDHVLSGVLTVPDAKELAHFPEEQRSKIIKKVVQSKEEAGKRVSGSVRNAIASETGKIHVMHVMGSSESPEWYTPQEIVRLVVACLGEIDLDPCSNSHDTPNVPARRLYTREDDGLAQEWHGKVYMNPPYGADIPAWIQKLVREYEELGHIQEAIILIPARIDTQWFQPLYAYPMCNIRGRLQFENAQYSAPFPSILVYLGRQSDKFIARFKDLGPIMGRIG